MAFGKRGSATKRGDEVAAQSVATGLLIVGDPYFLARYQPLVDALRKRVDRVDELAVHERAVVPKVLYFARALVRGALWPPGRATLSACIKRFRKEPATFARTSRLAARRIGARRPPPSLVLEIFSMFSPVTKKLRRPYAHYVDMTMALVSRQWPEWAPFESRARYDKWIALEGASYRGAERVFTFSESTRRSVIADYGVHPTRVVAVGAAGHFHAAASGERGYGNHTIVFNGSDFIRKGGDLVLAAFRLVRERFPDTTLTIVATSGLRPEPGLHVAGNVDRTELFALFDRADVLLAPTRMDVLPGFVFEAMSRGVVPILSDAPSMDEVITHGQEGYIASPTTPERLAAHVVELFEDESLLRSLGTAARARVARQGNWDSVASAMLESLEKLALQK